ncbi:hypothetical protein B9Z55_003173 [Caenorhabditis nigoni]|uniref:Uncharacterized protein n=1 Tax=Caenorhabditis nigoni TaxID=1611254 RepID=A0A2G5VP88_9PELO|nr:hypothetical protein B9Z55_003173 [Caenorhabditis nigoni]
MKLHFFLFFISLAFFSAILCQTTDSNSVESPEDVTDDLNSVETSVEHISNERNSVESEEVTSATRRVIQKRQIWAS